MEKSIEVEAHKDLKTEPCGEAELQATASSGANDVPRGSTNRKERKRTLTMNSAFAELRDHIPNVPPDTKLSKIKTLRLAISYIKFLMEILEDSNDGKPGRSSTNFVADLSLQSEGREKRKRESMASSSNQDASQRKRGRTGWPQYVWAMELRNWSSTIIIANLRLRVTFYKLTNDQSLEQIASNTFVGDLRNNNRKWYERVSNQLQWINCCL